MIAQRTTLVTSAVLVLTLVYAVKGSPPVVLPGSQIEVAYKDALVILAGLIGVNFVSYTWRMLALRYVGIVKMALSHTQQDMEFETQKNVNEARIEFEKLYRAKLQSAELWENARELVFDVTVPGVLSIWALVEVVVIIKGS